MKRPVLSKTLRLAVILVLLGLLTGCYVLYTTLHNSHNKTIRQACERADKDARSPINDLSVDQAICAGSVKP